VLSRARLFWYSVLGTWYLALGSPRKTASASRPLVNEKRAAGIVAEDIFSTVRYSIFEECFVFILLQEERRRLNTDCQHPEFQRPSGNLQMARLCSDFDLRGSFSIKNNLRQQTRQMMPPMTADDGMTSNITWQYRTRIRSFGISNPSRA